MPELAAKDVPIIIESMRPERLSGTRQTHDRQCDRSAVYFICINLISCVF
ncbi:MAG: hypothetical protein HXY43_07925 [Fischerella sp.]|nr:hypothetical protein [Fischerella sp.]NWF59223.1 hypothetical protein [Fischerella sp.]